MYSELNTEDIVKNRMFRNVPSDVDKSEGSLIFDAVSPASQEVAAIYIDFDNILESASPYTATGDDLEKITSPYGVRRKAGGKATTALQVNGIIGSVIHGGTLTQTHGGLQYKTIEEVILKDTTIMLTVVAVDTGKNYNVPSNIITELPIQLTGITSITNLYAVTNGYDTEDDESLRQRYFERLQTPATSGNKWHYRNWAKEVTGVGDAKVFPLWDKSNGKDGAGTVKVVIINSNKSAADVTLINAVSEHIEEERPIGAKITVISAIEKTINTTAKVILASGYNISDIQQVFFKLLDNYLKNIAFADTYLSYAKLGNILLNTPGALDYTDLKINNTIANIGLQDEEIPKIGIVELVV